MKIVKVVLPSEAELGRDILTQVPCSVTGCEKIFQHSAALNMHLVKVHKIIQSDRDMQLYSKSSLKTETSKGITIQYHCPVKDCKYHTDKKFFTTYSNLRQHYLKVHAEKQFKCRLCETGFGMERLLRRHSTRCNPLFKCTACNKQFADKSSLEKHCAATSHPFLFKSSQTLFSTTEKKGASEVCHPDTQPSDHLTQPSPTSRNEEIIPKVPEKAQIIDNMLLADPIVSKFQDKRESLQLTNNPVYSCHSERESRMIEDINIQHSIDNSQCISFTAESVQKSGKRNCVEVFSKKKVLTKQKILHTTSKSRCAVLTDQTKLAKEDLHINQTSLKGTRAFQSELQAIDISKPKTVGSRYQQISPGASHFPSLIPKKPQPLFVISPSFGGHVTVVNQNITVLPRQKFILPKTSCSCLAKASCSSVSQITVTNSDQLRVVPAASTATKAASKRESFGTQTVIPKKRVRREAAQTQTTGDYILKKAMRSANVPIIKQSKGSQVSPRAKLKRKASLQTSHTQTHVGGSVDPVRHKTLVSSSSSCNQGDAFTETQPAKLYNRSAISAMETQTFGLDLVSLSGTSQTGPSPTVKPVESAGTQTKHTYQNKNLPTQDSQIQTKLSMNMSLASCDSMDLQCLEELGIIPEVTPIVCDPLPNHLFDGHRDSLRSIVQADTVIDRKLVEMESSEKRAGHLSSSMILGSQNSRVLPDMTNSVSVQTAMDAFQDCSNVLTTAEMQVQTSVEDFDFPAFLSTEVQTTNFEQLYSNSTETQTTADNVLSDLLSHMETQTNEDDLSWMDLGFTDIQTQTCDAATLSSLEAVHVQTQTSVVDPSQRHSVEIQPGYANSGSEMGNTQSADNQTQTFFDLNLTDSHTQTSWNDLLKIVTKLN